MIKISAKIISNAKENKISEEVSDSQNRFFKIKVNQVAQDGKANDKVRELVADFFKVKKNQVEIVSGEKSQNKIIAIN
jgi:uncharacterized protein YggU (UPF0235/DUF167 family)